MEIDWEESPSMIFDQDQQIEREGTERNGKERKKPKLQLET